MKKINTYLVITALSSLTTVTFAQGETKAYYEIPDLPAPLYSISSNGKFATGEFEGAVTVYDIETRTAYSSYDEDNSGSALRCVSNNGVAGGMFGVDLDGAASLYLKGEWTVLPVPRGCMDQGSIVNCISADESVLAGYASNGMAYLPCAWIKEGDSYRAELLPAPGKDLWGETPQNVICIGTNDDGSVIYGRLNDFTGMYFFPVIWQKGAEGYACRILCEDLLINKDAEYPGAQPRWENYVTDPESQEQLENFEKILQEWWDKVDAYLKQDKVYISSGTLSGNGRYFAFNIGSKSYRMDLKDQDKLLEYNLEDALASGITDDGTMVFGAPLALPARTAYIAEEGVTTPVLMTGWLKEKHGLEIPEGEKYSVIGTPAVSSDGQTIVSYYTSDLVTGESIVIRLGGSSSITATKEPQELKFCDNHLYLATDNGYLMVSGVAGGVVYTGAVDRKVTDLSFLSPGFYVVKVIADGRTSVRKIAVN